MNRLLLLIFLVLTLPRAFAQALPVSSMQNAVSGVIQQKALSRGFAANDPRFGATLARSSNTIAGIAGTATAVTVGAVTAPGWASIALAAGLGAVVTYAVTLGIDGLVKWLFNSKTVDVSTIVVDTPGAGIVLGGPFWSAGGTKGTIYGGDGIAVARQAYMEWASQYGNDASPICSLNGGIALCVASKPDQWGGTLSKQALYYSDGAPSSCNPGSFYSENGGCQAYLADGGQSLQGATLPQAVAALPQSELNKELNPAVVAALADQVWKSAAAQPGYDGIPYIASDPISPPDAAKWQQANPNAWPTVQDFVSPQIAPENAPSATPWTLPNTASPTSTLSPSTNTQTTTINPASSNPLENLGPDPAIGSPNLENPPTALQILQPILSLFSDLRSYSVPSHSGACPKPSLDLWSKHLVLDGHCELLENNRTAIQGVMAMVWVVLALFIVLTA